MAKILRRRLFSKIFESESRTFATNDGENETKVEPKAKHPMQSSMRATGSPVENPTETIRLSSFGTSEVLWQSKKPDKFPYSQLSLFSTGYGNSQPQLFFCAIPPFGALDRNSLLY
jgi:hypothetical protein